MLSSKASHRSQSDPRIPPPRCHFPPRYPVLSALLDSPFHAISRGWKNHELSSVLYHFHGVGALSSIQEDDE